MSTTKTVSVPHLNASAGYQYVLSQSVFSSVGSLFSPETSFGNVDSVDMF